MLYCILAQADRQTDRQTIIQTWEYRHTQRSRLTDIQRDEGTAHTGRETYWVIPDIQPFYQRKSRNRQRIRRLICEICEPENAANFALKIWELVNNSSKSLSMDLKWQCHEIFWHFFHESNLPRPLLNRLKWFCWKVCFRGDICKISNSMLTNTARSRTFRT